ncbi:MAG: TonB-dependent receptor [Burkholderiales bacterium]|nr:TonB-dependent receptor [Burkholderiales bacterium]
MFKTTRVSQGLMLAFGGSLALASLPALAQDSNQRVEITGSSIKRIDSEAALPVTVITRKDIESTGATSAAELLEKITANNGQGYAQSLALGDSARPGFAGASLRGLGSNTTLILLNGRRLAVYAFDGGAVDLNGIALGAIERVEVLRDGASAVYGTDAIAGVINFITRKDFRGGEVAVSTRQPNASSGGSGGNVYNASATAGFGDLGKDRFNVFGNLTYDKYEPLKASARSYSSTSFLPNAPGGAFNRTSGNTIPASILVPGVGTVNPGVPNCLAPFSFQTSATSACRFDYAATIDIVPPQEKTAGLLRGTFALSPNAELFAEYNATRTKSQFAVSPTPASGATTFNGDPVLYPAGGKYYPKAINPATGKLENGLLWYDSAGKLTRFVPLSGDLSIFWRTLEAGPRTNQAVADQSRVLLGAQGSFGSWDYNTAVLKSESKATESYINGWLSETRLLNATCATSPCGPLSATYTPHAIDPAINPFGLNDAAGLAALQKAKLLQDTRISKSTRESWDGRLSGDLLQLPAGPLSAALGAEFRREKYDDNPLPVLSSGDVIGGGGDQQPVNGSRTVKAVFGEFSIPVFKGFEALAQFRYDKYSDFGNTTNPKVGFRWQALPTLVARASYGTGFRAPTLPDLLAPVTQTNTGGSYNDPYYEARVGNCFDSAGAPSANFNPSFCQAQLTVKQGGNPNLGPEKSKQWNIGLVFQPVKDWSATVDFWKIKLRDEIAIPDADQRLGDFISQFLTNPGAAYDASTAKLTAAGKAALNGGATGAGIVRNASTGNLAYVSIQFDNIAKIDTSGVDVSLRGVLARTEYGQFNLGLETAYLMSRKQDNVETVGQYLQFGPVVRMKNNVMFDWNLGNWSSNLSYHWQSSYADVGNVRRVGSYETFDLSVVYTGIKNLSLRAGVQNLLDRDPPYSRQGDYFQVGFDPTYVDPRGRTFVLGARYTFK